MDVCEPYTWAAVTSASLEPTRLAPGDPRVEARVRAELRTCGEFTPAIPEVQIVAISGARDESSPFDASARDAGGSSGGIRVFQLGSVRAHAASDATIDVTIPNPFDGRVPENTELTLRFTPLVAGCEGDAFTVAYRTGSRASR